MAPSLSLWDADMREVPAQVPVEEAGKITTELKSPPSAEESWGLSREGPTGRV